MVGTVILVLTARITLLQAVFSSLALQVNFIKFAPSVSYYSMGFSSSSIGRWKCGKRENCGQPRDFWRLLLPRPDFENLLKMWKDFVFHKGCANFLCAKWKKCWKFWFVRCVFLSYWLSLCWLMLLTMSLTWRARRESFFMAFSILFTLYIMVEWSFLNSLPIAT